ncbi:MAG: hypothetical protein MSS69_05410 [Spirochaetales bacterium]|nr:hypothetical protein [Spirochaetales bacterium]
MAKNELRLIITADGKRALDTIDATERNIKSLGSQTLKLEQDLKSGIERTAGMADAFRQMNDVVNRYAISMNELNPAISQNEAALKAWKAMMESVITKGGAFGSETLEYIKMQYASVAEQIQKATEQITNESKSIENTTKSVEKVSKAATNLAVNTKKASSYWSKLFDTTKNVLQFRVIMNVINSIAGLKNLLKEASQAAAEAEQKFSKLNTVFGKTSNAMSKAISLASKLGVATSTAASSLSTVGDLLQAQGMYTTESLETAYEWISQFQDIIAFKDINMSLEEFAQNFMSGAAGNLRNFRTFGSIVRESAVNAELAKKGLDNLTGSELELAKMTTRAEMALEQQKNAIGATQREWDTMLSVQRRYEEAMIKFQENLGNSLNPVIKMWMQLKTVMLEVFTAQQTWNEKQKMVEEKKALDTKYATFGKDGEIVNQSNYLGFRSYIDAANTAYVNASSEKKQLKVLNDLMISIQEYGATVPDLTRTFADIVKSGGAIDSDFWIQAVDYASDYLLKLQEIKKEEEDINNLLSKANQADSFFEQIQAIKGVDLTNVSYYNTFIKALDEANANGITDKEAFKKTIEDALFFGLGEAKIDIDSLGLSLIEKTFSSDPFLETLEKRRDTYKELYEISVNSGKYQEEDVQFIAEEWKNANKQIDDYIKKKDLLSSLSSGTADYTKQLEQMGMSEFEKTIDDLNRMLEGVTDKDIISAINAQIEAFTKLTEATNEYNAEQEMKKKWEDLGTQASDSLGEFGTLISSFGSEGMPDLLSTLVQIVSQTEAFTRLSSILTDSILPVLNAFLEPIIPLIDQLSSIISNLAQSVLIPFFPILQGISAAIAGLFGIVDATFSAIASSIKWTMGWALGWIEDAVNTVVGWFGGGKADWGFIDWRNENPGQVFKDKINKTNDTIEKILGYSMEIADNTSDNDFDTYKKLLLAKEINQETYNKWTGMDRYTTQSLANGVSYTTGNRSYVNVNNLTVQVPEGMTLVEFLKGIDDYNNGHGLYSVNTLVS